MQAWGRQRVGFHLSTSEWRPDISSLVLFLSALELNGDNSPQNGYCIPKLKENNIIGRKV